LIPPFVCFDALSISANIIHPFVDRIESREGFYMPSNHSVKPGVWFVKRANAYTVAAASVIFGPESKAFLGIDGPF